MTTRYTIHVPEQLNDGAPTPAPTLATVEDALLAIAGGFTLTHGIGAWRGDDGRIYREPVRLYAVDTDAADGLLLRELAERVARELDQEAVYLTAADVEQHFVPQAEQVSS